MAIALPAMVAVGAIAAWQLTPSDTAATGAHLAAALGPLVTTASSEPAVIRALREAGSPSASADSAASAQAAASSHPSPRPSAPASPQPAASATPSASPSAGASSAAFSCTGNAAGPLLPANYGTIVTFLVANGYTPIAAAGIAGNIYQESGGNPESVGTGGGGLIGWTPLPAGFVTGNVQADLQTQLQALLTYNQQWAANIPLLNSSTSPAQAADVYMADFERPGIPATGNREGAAVAVAQACGISS